MKHVQPFDSFVNEAKLENHKDRHNSFYWDESNGKLVYQIPYIFPNQGEPVEIDANNLEGADRKKLYDIAKKANDAINKEVEAAEKAISKIGEDAAKEFAKVVNAAKK
jgi:hypothetical protein